MALWFDKLRWLEENLDRSRSKCTGIIGVTLRIMVVFLWAVPWLQRVPGFYVTVCLKAPSLSLSTGVGKFLQGACLQISRITQSIGHLARIDRDKAAKQHESYSF